ncbi:MAG: DnaD domain protein [Anaerolineae bacterium]|nr:DnaD domain protein [Anaerolineae bacterium]MDW7991601.1 DnaD domain protein [Anaerolineae bacterium]
MRTFSGFPEGKTGVVRLPEVVFTELLPLVDDLDELKVILHVLYRLQQGKGPIRFVSQRRLLGDPVLLRGLEGPEAIRTALDRAVERGVLLQAEAEVDGRPDVVYLANSPRGRAALEALRQGMPLEEPPSPRPNIFVLYEENIGPLTPLIAEELKEAEATYPADWIEAAFREAVALNKRSWKYIRAILERWHAEGRPDETDRRDREGDRRRYIEGEHVRW